MLQDCGHDISLTNQEIFSRVFASQEINFRYDPRNEASIASLLELSPDTFRHIIDFDDSAFDLGGDNLSEERRRVLSENVIIHELGHVFHNALGVAEGFYADGESATATLEGEIPFNAQDVYEQISVTVKQNTPQVIIDFWQATNSYWSNLDFGFGREAGVFTEIDSRNDPTIVPLTKSIYRTYIGIPRENSEESCSQCPENTLVYITGTGGECFRGNDNTCITINNATQYNVSPIYIRDPAFTYRPNYAEDTVDSLQVEDREGNPFTFSNLYRNETRNIDPSPLEGFADTFLTYVRSSGGSNTFPEDEPRRQFFDENLCRWLSSLIEG